MSSLALRPGDSLTIPKMASSMGFRASVSLLPAIRATGLLAATPAGLTPAERISVTLDAPTHSKARGPLRAACFRPKAISSPLRGAGPGRSGRGGRRRGSGPARRPRTPTAAAGWATRAAPACGAPGPPPRWAGAAGPLQRLLWPPLPSLSHPVSLRECRRHSLDLPHGLWAVDFLTTARAMEIAYILHHVPLPLESSGPISVDHTDSGAPARRTGRHLERSYCLSHHSALLEETRK